MTLPVQLRAAGMAALILGATSAIQAQTIVYSNNVGGDSFTNNTGVNMGQALGASGWYYNNVRADGVAGISTTYPFGTNGSAGLSGPTNAKADIEFLPNAVEVGGNYYSNASLGNLGDLSSMSYNWYRNSASTAPTHFHPSLRVLVDIDGDLGTNDRAALIFELAYNPSVSPVPTDQWVANVVDGSTILWGNSPLYVAGNPVFQSLGAWQTQLSSAAIVGFSSGIGSGWSGSFEGAVDGIGWQIGSTAPAALYDFEVLAVPEPSSYLLMALGLGVLGAHARRRSLRRA